MLCRQKEVCHHINSSRTILCSHYNFILRINTFCHLLFWLQSREIREAEYILYHFVLLIMLRCFQEWISSMPLFPAFSLRMRTQTVRKLHPALVWMCLQHKDCKRRERSEIVSLAFVLKTLTRGTCSRHAWIVLACDNGLRKRISQQNCSSPTVKQLEIPPSQFHFLKIKLTTRNTQ